MRISVHIQWAGVRRSDANSLKWHSQGNAAYTESTNDAPSIDSSERMLSCEHDGCTNAENSSGQNKSGLAAETLSKWIGEQSTKEASGLVGGHNVGGSSIVCLGSRR